MNTKRPEDRSAPTSPPPPYPGYPPSYAYYPAQEEASLLDYWDILVKYKWFITLSTIACTAAALAAALLMTPIYRAEVLLAPVSQEETDRLSTLTGQLGDLAVLTGVNLRSGKDTTAESIATLKSRSLSVAFMKAENIVQALASKKWHLNYIKRKDQEDALKVWDAFEVFDEDVRSVEINRRTGLVKLAIEWDDPVLAARWANLLVKRVNAKRRANAIQDAEKSIAYLKKQLAKTNVVEIQQAIYRLIEAQTKTKMLASTREEYAFKVIDPAVSPDEDKFVKPKRLLIMALGFTLGAFLGISTAYFRNRLQQRETSERKV